MKIAAIDTFLVPPGWLFVRVRTDDGPTGWGEIGVKGRAGTASAAVAELAPLIVGRDPLRIEDHWQVLTRAGFFRGGPILSSAVAGIDQALWDIAGKVRGAPVHELLGGPVRDRLRVYGWVWEDEDDWEASIAAQACAQIAHGHRVLKMAASRRLLPIDTAAAVAEVEARARAIREAIGGEHDFALDCHGRATPAMARRTLQALEPYRPYFVEEPVLGEHDDSLARLAAATSIPLATGERLYSRWECKRIVASGVAILQPDAGLAGGISEMRRIAVLAETYGVAIAPHHSAGPISFAASVQVCFATPNVVIQEWTLSGDGYESPFRQYIGDPFPISDGMIERPTAPGLGIDVAEDLIVELARPGVDQPITPMWRHPDGSLAEW